MASFDVFPELRPPPLTEIPNHLSSAAASTTIESNSVSDVSELLVEQETRILNTVFRPSELQTDMFRPAMNVNIPKIHENSPTAELVTNKTALQLVAPGMAGGAVVGGNSENLNTALIESRPVAGGHQDALALRQGGEASPAAGSLCPGNNIKR